MKFYMCAHKEGGQEARWERQPSSQGPSLSHHHRGPHHGLPVSLKWARTSAAGMGQTDPRAHPEVYLNMCSCAG